MKHLFSRVAVLGGLVLLNPLTAPISRADLFVIEPKSPQIKEARQAFASALPIIMGTWLHPVDSQELYPLLKTFNSPKYGGAAQYKEGISFSEAATFLKWRLKNENIERTGLVYRVYRDAFGRNPSDGDLKYWLPRVRDEGKWWFFTMIPVNVKWMNEFDLNEKKTAIDRSYRAAFGREATSMEFADKMKGDGHFRKLREEHRAFLWGQSPAGKAELRRMFTVLAQKYYKLPASEPISDKQMALLAFIYNPGNNRNPTFQEIEFFEITRNWPTPKELLPVN